MGVDRREVDEEVVAANGITVRLLAQRVGWHCAPRRLAQAAWRARGGDDRTLA